MKSTLLSLLLAIGFLSAGAFAGDTTGTGSATPAMSAVSVITPNITVIRKNQAWPLPVLADPCQQRRCIAI
jgi:hypothetical protein